MFWMCARFAGICARFAGICARFAGMFHMFPRNRLYEMREAAAVAKTARIQNCARSPEKRPTSKFMLRNTQGTQIDVTNEGPGYYMGNWNPLGWLGNGKGSPRVQRNKGVMVDLTWHSAKRGLFVGKINKTKTNKT